jgi:hypothetical protein
VIRRRIEVFPDAEGVQARSLAAPGLARGRLTVTASIATANRATAAAYRGSAGIWSASSAIARPRTLDSRVNDKHYSYG